MAALWLRMSRTAGSSEASAGAPPGSSAGTELLLVVHDSLERVVVVDPRALEAGHELRGLGMVGEKLPQRVVLVVDVLVTFLQVGGATEGGRG